MNIITECATEMRSTPAWPAVFDAGTAEVLTEAVFRVLRRRLMINEWGLEAIKQAEREKEKEQ